MALGKKKPRQASLRRACSTTYYALFHTLCSSCADLLIGKSAKKRTRRAWTQAYRSVEHGIAKDALLQNKLMDRFPVAIQDFAQMFLTMQEKRHRADYDPSGQFHKSAVAADIKATRTAISHFQAAPIEDRKAFAALVVFKAGLRYIR